MFTSRHEEALEETYQLSKEGILHYSQKFEPNNLENQFGIIGSSSNQDIELDDLRISSESETSFLFDTLKEYSERTIIQEDIVQEKEHEIIPIKRNNNNTTKKFQLLLKPLEVWIDKYWIWMFAFCCLLFFLWVLIFYYQ